MHILFQLQYLRKLPVSTLKIDSSFVALMNDEADNFPQAIVTLAHGLGLDVVAEGIETAEDVHRLRSMMCESGQGFYFAKPLDPEEIAAYMRTPANQPGSQSDDRDAAKRFPGADPQRRLPHPSIRRNPVNASLRLDRD